MWTADGGMRARCIAVANQKGGVGKTTTAINFCAALVECGHKVLLIDLDPQGNASTGLGIGPELRRKTAGDLLLDDVPLREVVQETSVPGLFICPGTADLSSADMELVHHEKRSFLLRDALHHPDVDALGFTYIVIDCPPSLNLLTVNALVASQSVLVPLQCEFFALEGLSQLMLSVREIRQSANPTLRIEGVLLTMYDRRNNLTQLVEEDARSTLGDLVFQTVIPRNVRLSEAPSFSMTILAYDGASTGARAYRDLAKEILTRHSESRTTGAMTA